ncbi:alpha/beta hydrolase [Rhizobium giardinii]|uniref:Esterase/lipase superfamily enzyme n=1 Tax=Rhizobium giardinii TaxID=56731 RepID=A0A7W8X7V6_9HYPH|nr:alpha/beta hydrolase [Rhizobium giardinii]MBB5534872.1 esterase/lipase superfamily enzyme [Rhizobium giardinii]
MADRWHVNWLSEGVERWNKRRKKVDFSPELSGVKFFDLLPPDFRDSPKTSRFFEGIDLSNANLTGADLSGLNFYNGKFSYSDLTGADMSMSNFNNATFIDANLSGANLTRSLLIGTVFENSRLLEVSFADANVSNAIFLGSDFDNGVQESIEKQSAHVFEDRDAYEAQFAVNRSAIQINDSVSHRLIGRKAADEKTRKNKYDVFFGTNRTPVFTRGVLVDFNRDHTTNISYGVCEVIVPNSHKIGSLGSPLWKRLLNRKDDRLRLDSLIPLNEELFWSFLKSTSDKMRIKERPTIFVHGFNNTFEQAVLRAAQIGYDIGLGQGIGLFSWPSKGSMTAYNADEASSESSKYALADFIEQFVENSRQKSANIIAHSMGCRTVLGALEVLSSTRSHVLKRLNQIILAAADVDTGIMPYVGVHAINHSTRTTSYVSETDTALKVSGWLHGFPRVGVTPPVFVLSGMDTILVNNLDLGEFSHGYLSASRTILNDIFALLSANSPPNERHAVESVKIGAQQYWRINDQSSKSRSILRTTKSLPVGPKSTAPAAPFSPSSSSAASHRPHPRRSRRPPWRG